jgi:hypothetical protein
MNAHRLGELRSIAYHRRVAERLATHPEILDAARSRLEEWIAHRPRHAASAELWLDLVNGDLDRLTAVMCADDELSRELRQSTPFAGALDPRERWAIWSAVREQHA